MSASEEFDLEAARRARSTTPDEERTACEHCHSVSVSRVATQYNDAEWPYRCEHCGRGCEGTGDGSRETLSLAEVSGGERL